MTITTQTYSQLLSNEIAAMQASSNQFIDVQVGSITLAYLEAVTAGLGLWLQAMYVQLLATTRLASSTGNDVDTFGNDFGFERLPAVAATGQATFSRFTNTQQAIINVGATIASSDGTQTFAVIADTTNTNYNSGLNAYVINGGTSSANVTVQDIVAGAAGNMAIGQLNTITSSIPFVDTVTNAAAFTNGINEETDAAYKIRFVQFINNLSRATKGAIEYAISLVGQNLTYTLTENFNYNGSPNNGYFYVVVDDGSHDTPSQTLTNVGASIELYRPLGVTYGVFAPVTTTANVSMTITVTAGASHTVIAPIVQTAVTNYVNALTLGQSLYYTRLEQVAYDSSPYVLDVFSVLLNSGTSDVTADNNHVIIAGTITIN